MTPERFRQWIVILLAVSIITVWVGMGLKFYKWKVCGPDWQKGEMMRYMPMRTTPPPQTRMPMMRGTQPSPSTQQPK